MGELKAEKSGNEYVVTTGNSRIYSLKLNGLKSVPGGEAADVPVKSSGDLGDMRLVVSTPDPKGGWLPPIHSVPAVAADHMIPATLTGASFENSVLRLPDVTAPKIRLTLAKGARPNEFEANPMALDTVEGTESVVPRDVQVIAPDGSVAWAFPGDFPPELDAVDVDLRVPLQTALSAAVQAGNPPDVTFNITGSGTISVHVIAADGALLRETPGVVRTVLAGEPETLAIGDPVPEETPTSATADLQVKYDGIRILDTVSDRAPSTVGGIAGVIVADAGALRHFPPQALTGRVVRRVAVIGRAPVDCQLQIQLVEAASGTPIGPAGTLSLSASTELTAHWAELPDLPPISVPTDLLVKATGGRFFWVIDGRPLAKVAIYDPDYPGRELTLGGALLNVPTDRPNPESLPSYALPPAAFSHAPVALESDLFLTVDVADLVLSYMR